MRKFDPDALWETVQRTGSTCSRSIGDAMARPLMRALAAGNYDTSSLVSLNSTAALFSPASRMWSSRRCPACFLTEAIGSTETGFTGMALHSAGGEHRGGPRSRPAPTSIVIDEAGRACGPGQTGKLARGGHIPLGYYKDPVKTAEMFTEVNGRRYAVRATGRVETGWHDNPPRPRQHVVNTGGERSSPRRSKAR